MVYEARHHTIVVASRHLVFLVFVVGVYVEGNRKNLLRREKDPLYLFPRFSSAVPEPIDNCKNYLQRYKGVMAEWNEYGKCMLCLGTSKRSTQSEQQISCNFCWKEYVQVFFYICLAIPPYLQKQFFIPFPEYWSGKNDIERAEKIALEETEKIIDKNSEIPKVSEIIFSSNIYHVLGNYHLVYI